MIDSTELRRAAGLEAELHPDFNAARRAGGRRQTEEWRLLVAAEVQIVRTIQQVVTLHVEVDAEPLVRLLHRHHHRPTFVAAGSSLNHRTAAGRALALAAEA